MWKTVLAGTTALAIVGGTLAYAQQGQADSNGRSGWRPSAEDVAAFGDARIAALHAGLKLTAEQEKNWPAVESALRDLAKQRSERFAARASADRPKDPIERLNLRADVMGQRAAALKKLADAAGPALQEPRREPEASLHDACPARRRAIRWGTRSSWLRGWQHHGPRGGMMGDDTQVK